MSLLANNCSSNCCPVISSFPQGNILGPLPFLIFWICRWCKVFLINHLTAPATSLALFFTGPFTIIFCLTSLNFFEFHKLDSQYIVDGHIINESSFCKRPRDYLHWFTSWGEHYKSLGSRIQTVHRLINPSTYCSELLYCSSSSVETLFIILIEDDYIHSIWLFIRLQIQFSMLPLVYSFEIADILFFIKSLNNQTDKFKILNYSISIITIRSSALS